MSDFSSKTRAWLHESGTSGWHLNETVLQEFLIAVIGFVIMLLVIWVVWNFLIARCGKFPRITLWSAAGIWILSRILRFC